MPTTPPPPPTRVTTSPTRDRNIAHDILDEMESLEHVPRSPETEVLWEECKAKATRQATHPGDPGPVEDCWRMTLKLVEDKDAARNAEGHLRRQLAESEDEMSHLKYLLRIGDWIRDINTGMKRYEENMLKGKENPFTAIWKHPVPKTVSQVEEELDRLKQWRDGGEAGPKPTTQSWDRIGDICQKLKIDRDFYLSLLQRYDERNRTAHHPPPSFRNDDATVNWNVVRATCESQKIGARTDCESGKLSEPQRDFFIKTIDTWSTVRFDEWTRGVNESSKKRKNQHKTKAHPAPPRKKSKRDGVE